MIWISLEGWSSVTDYSSSAGKESTCNVGDTGLIPWLGRSPGEGIGYPLQYSWASLVALMVKNLLGMWETWVWSLGWEDPLKEGMATHSSILAWRIRMDRGAWWATAHGVAESWIQLSIAQHNTKSEYLNIFCDTISDHFAAHLKLTQHCKSFIPPQKNFQEMCLLPPRNKVKAIPILKKQ